MLPSLLFTRTKETTTTTTTTMIPLGLKTLADTNLSAPPSPMINCVTRNNILAVRSSPPPSPAEERRIGSVPVESEGTEEEVEEDEEEEYEEEDTCWAAYGRRGKVGGRGLPPPIPHKRVLQRTYAGDGRLVIREVISERHVYFRARRRGGRLTLRLVEYFSAACTSKREEEDAEEENSMGEISSEPLDLFMGEDPAGVASPALCGEGCYGVDERSNRFMQMPLSSIPTVHG